MGDPLQPVREFFLCFGIVAPNAAPLSGLLDRLKGLLDRLKRVSGGPANKMVLCFDGLGSEVHSTLFEV